MADQPEPPREQPRRAKPVSVKRPAPKQMSLWDSLMLILRPDRKTSPPRG